jgi:hypothetical protein
MRYSEIYKRVYKKVEEGKYWTPFTCIMIQEAGNGVGRGFTVQGRKARAYYEDNILCGNYMLVGDNRSLESKNVRLTALALAIAVAESEGL